MLYGMQGLSIWWLHCLSALHCTMLSPGAYHCGSARLIRLESAGLRFVPGSRSTPRLARSCP